MNDKKSGAGHVTGQLAAYLDHELPEPERALVREHLRGCPACEQEFVTLGAAKSLLRDLPPVALPRSFKLSVDQVGALPGRQTSAGRARPRVLPRLVLALRLGAAAALLMLLLVGGTDYLNRSTATFSSANTASVPQLGAQSRAAQASSATASPAPPAMFVPAVAPTTTTAAAAPAAAQPSEAAGLAAATPNPEGGVAAAGTSATVGAAPAAGGGAADQTATKALKNPAGVPSLPPPAPAADHTTANSTQPLLPPQGVRDDQPRADSPFRFWPVELSLGLLALGLAAASFLVHPRGR